MADNPGGIYSELYERGENSIVIPIPPKLPNATLIAALAAMLSQLMLVAQSREGAFGTAVRRVCKAAGVVRHPFLQLRIVRTMLGAEFRRVAVAQPLVMFKNLGDYLGHGLSRLDRARALLGHYTFLRSNVRSGFFSRIVDGKVALWSSQIDGHDYSIHLTFPPKTHHEGELSLLFGLDGVCIYTLSFSFGPGSIAGADGINAMYVVRVQGKGGGFESIRLATRACEDISPAALLLAAAEGIALAVGIAEIIGISAKCQLSAGLDSRPGGLVSAYDQFWQAVGGSPLNGSMYRLDVPVPDKPIAEIKRHHRSRVLRKREFRASVRDQVTSTVRSEIIERRASGERRLASG